MIFSYGNNNNMKNTKTIKTILFATLILTLIIPTTSFSIANAEDEKLPLGKIMTPFGPWDENKVHEWDGKTPIDADVIIEKWQREHPDEKSPAQKIIEERAQKRTEIANQRSNGEEPIPTHHGWNMAAWYDHGSAMDKFTGTWSVPNDPVFYQTGDAIFTFISMETADFQAIIQPVLQYGTSAKCAVADWRIASWFVIADQAWFASTCQNADPGDVISGDMTRNFGQTWTIKTKNVSDNITTSLQVSTSRNWVNAQVAYESWYLAHNCDSISNDVHFTNLSLNNGAITPTWTETYWTTWCGMDVNIVSPTHVDLNNNN